MHQAPSSQGSKSPRTSKRGSALNQLALTGAEEKFRLPATNLTRFVGRYEFFSSSEPSFKEAVVEIVGGQLTIDITGNIQTLMPTTSQSRRLTSTINVVSFRVVGHPDTCVRFFVSGENLMGLYYEERRKDDDLVVGVAAPKSSAA